MAFRWPSTKHDIALATEVARARPEKPSEWDKLAEPLSKPFSTEKTVVSLKGRGCRERMERLLKKYKEEDAKSLKRYDITRALIERTLDVGDDTDSGSDMEDMLDDSTSDGKKVNLQRAPRKRASRLSAIQMLENKYEKKADFKERELEQRKLEFELQKRKYEEEALERKEKMKLELEERRVFLSLLKEKLTDY
ncbi:hypothetical protein QZH41_015522 [Actinostola sp. cb2023]|nr:hypothetical protein QZH41_015522 [Actinostola sp. cb2023]